MLKYQNDWRKMHRKAGERVYIASYLEVLGLPEGWKQMYNSIYDAMGNRFVPFTGAADYTDVGFDFYFKSTDGAAQLELCQQFMLNTAIPFQNDLYRLFIYRTSEVVEEIWYGNYYCSQNKKCISDMTLSDILRLCNSCVEGQSCMLALYF